MNKNVLVIGTGIVFILMIITLVVFTNKSTFMEMNYGSCTRDNRNYPQGKVPGSYLGLSQSEREGLLVNFILNDPNKMI
jgi:hypothetical protein